MHWALEAQERQSDEAMYCVPSEPQLHDPISDDKYTCIRKKGSWGSYEIPRKIKARITALISHILHYSPLTNVPGVVKGEKCPQGPYRLITEGGNRDNWEEREREVTEKKMKMTEWKQQSNAMEDKIQTNAIKSDLRGKSNLTRLH